MSTSNDASPRPELHQQQERVTTRQELRVRSDGRAWIASSTESTRRYSKGAGIMPHLRVADRFPHALGRRRLPISVTPRCDTSTTALITAGGAAIVPACRSP
jgi:hypothetical protein